jgi:GT2 family glycosyltransferase
MTEQYSEESLLKVDRDQEIPSVSILILNRNGRDLLEECLASVYENTKYPRYEIVLIDNNSNDESVPFVESHFPAVTIIQNGENLGFAEANNRGIKNTDSDYVVLLNNDTIVESGWLTNLARVSIKDCNNKIVSPKLIYGNGDPQFLGDKVLLDESGIPNPINDIIIKIESCFDREKEIYRSIGASMLIQRNLFDKIGYLDEDYEFYMEEFDFCLRARNAGYSVKYTPKSEVVHKSRTSAGTDPYFSFYLRRRSRVRFYLLNFSVLRILLQIPIEATTIVDSFIRGYSRWLFKGYWDALKNLSELLELRSQRPQYHHTTNKIRILKRRALSVLEPVRKNFNSWGND